MRPSLEVALNRRVAVLSPRTVKRVEAYRAAWKEHGFDVPWASFSSCVEDLAKYALDQIDALPVPRPEGYR